MRAPVGAVVAIYYDGRPVFPGDALVTMTGRVYVVASRRVQGRGKHKGRQHLRCLVAAREPRGTGAQILPLYWYPRGRQSKRVALARAHQHPCEAP